MTLPLFVRVSFAILSFYATQHLTLRVGSLYILEFLPTSSVGSTKFTLESWVSCQHEVRALHPKIQTIPQNRYFFQSVIAQGCQIAVRANGEIQRSPGMFGVSLIAASCFVRENLRRVLARWSSSGLKRV